MKFEIRTVSGDHRSWLDYDGTGTPPPAGAMVHPETAVTMVEVGTIEELMSLVNFYIAHGDHKADSTILLIGIENGRPRITVHDEYMY